MLAVLPQGLRDELRPALESLDSERIHTILQQVKLIDVKLHSTLSCLAANFDYLAILKVLPTH
jgi:hypothetical protein